MKESVLRIVGVRHDDPRSLETADSIVDAIGEQTKGSTLFLLEYTPETLKAHEKRYSRRGILCRLVRRPVSEFYHLTRILDKRGIRYCFIDTLAQEAKREFVERTGLGDLLRLLAHRRTSGEAGAPSAAFMEQMMTRREKAMADEICRKVQHRDKRRFIIVVGEDHGRRLQALLRERIPHAAITVE